MTLLEDAQVVALAGDPGPSLSKKGHIRHVKTPEGAKFYGLPIGSPISAHLREVIKKSKAALGITAPADADALSTAPVPKAELEQYAAQGYPVSELGDNKHLDIATLNEATFDAMNPGTGLHIVYHDGVFRVLKKNDQGTWDAQGFDSPVDSHTLASIMPSADNVVKTSDGPPASSTFPTNLKPGDTIQSAEHLASLDDGSHVQHKLTKAVYQKQGDTLLSTKGGYNKKASSLKKVFAQQNLQYHSPPTKDGADTIDPNGPSFQPGAVLDQDQVGALQAGEQIMFGPKGETYTANGDGSYVHDKLGVTYGTDAFTGAAAAGMLTYVGKKPADGQALTPEQVKSLPAGDQVVSTINGNVYTADGNGDFTYSAGAGHETVAVKGDDLAAGAKDGIVLYKGKEGSADGGPAAGDAAGAPAAGDGGVAAGGDGPDGGNAGAGGPSTVPEGVGPAGSGSGLAGQQDSGHDEAGLELKFGGDATVKQEVPQSDAIKALAAAGKPAPQFVELDPATSAGAFHAAIQALKDHNTHASSVYVYPEDEYKQMRLFLTKDGTAGFALHGDDVVSVFSHPKDDGHGQGFGPAIIQTAVDSGGKRLDAFDTTLPTLYAKAGFVAVARVKWNDEYAPEGWNAEDFKAYNGGKPDVVFMALAPDGKGHYTPGDGVTIENYDDGAAVQQNFLTTGVIKKPKSSPLAPDSPPTTGEHVTDLKHITGFPVGTVLTLQTPADGTFEYTKDADNSWSDDKGVTGIGDQAFGAAVAGKGGYSLTVKSLPPTDEEKAAQKAQADAAKAQAAAAAEKAAKKAEAASGKLPEVPSVPDSQKQGEPVTEPEYIKAYAVGSSVDVHYTVGGNGTPFTLHFNKIQSNTWKTDPSQDADLGGDGLTWSNAMIGTEAIKGNVYLIHEPDSSNLYNGAPPAGAVPLAPAEPDMDSPSVSVVPGESLLSKNDVATSLAALQKASGFQVVYGLKGTPLGNPDMVKMLTNQAQGAYPGIPAKPAVIAFLKSKLGITDATPVLAKDEPLIHVGAVNPKSTGVQGLNGGDFTKSQIEDAIKILQGHKGKVFKSELAKQGSPLSALNPVSMIEAEKDKAANKAKFIAVLQKALDDFNAKAPAAVNSGPAPTDGMDTTVETGDFDPSAFKITVVALPTPAASEAAPEQKFPTPQAGEEIDSATILGATIGSKFALNGHIYTKISDGIDGGQVQAGENGTKNKLLTLMQVADTKKDTPKPVTWISGGVKPLEDSAVPTQPDNAVGVPDVSYMATMKTGALVFLKNAAGETATFQKQDDGTWLNLQSKATLDMTAIDTSGFLFTEPKNLVQTGGPVDALQPSFAPISLAEVQNLKAGQTIAVKLGDADPSPSSWVTLQPDGSWASDSMGTPVSPSWFDAVGGEKANFVHVIKPASKKTGFVAPIDIEYPVLGQQVDVHSGYATNSPKTGTFSYFPEVGMWINDSDMNTTFSQGQMKSLVKGGYVVWHEPVATAAAKTGSVASADIASPTDGMVVYAHGTIGTAPPTAYTWHADTQNWLADDGYLRTQAWMQKWADNGNVTWDAPAAPAPKTGKASGLDIPNYPLKGDVLYQKYGTAPAEKISWTGSQWTEDDGTYAGTHELIKTLASQGAIYWDNPDTAKPTGVQPLQDIQVSAYPADGDVLWLKVTGGGPAKQVHFNDSLMQWMNDSGESEGSPINMKEYASSGWVYGENPDAPVGGKSGGMVSSSDLDAVSNGMKVKYTTNSGKVITYAWDDQNLWWTTTDGAHNHGKAWMKVMAEDGKVSWATNTTSAAPAGKTGALSGGDVQDLIANVNSTPLYVIHEDGMVAKYHLETYPGQFPSYKFESDALGTNSHGGMWMIQQAAKGNVSWNDPSVPGSGPLIETAPGDLPPKKDFIAGDTVASASLQFLKAGDLVKAFSDSPTVLAKQNNGLFVNPETGTVYTPPFVKDLVGDHGFFVGHDDSKIFDVPYTGPDYIHTPKSHFSTGTTAAEAQAFTGDNAMAAPVGTMLVGADGTFYEKVDANTWTRYKDGKIVSSISNSPGGSFYKLVDSKQVQPYVVAGPKTSKYDILPGKYGSGAGAAYMVVQADGSGVYVNSAGTVKKLTVEAVKKNFDAGMTNYAGVPDVMPTVTEHTAKKAVKKIGDVPDSTYYDGYPDGQKTSVYVIEGDKVTLHKPMPAKIGGGQEVGAYPTPEWMEAAGAGATFKNNYAGSIYKKFNGWGKTPEYTEIAVDGPSHTITKQEDGTWKDGNGKVVDPQAYLQETIPGDPSLNKYYNHSITSHGLMAPVTLDKKKANTLFAQGKLLDANGNSVHADGYDGSITVLGWQQPVALLLKAQKVLADAQPGDDVTKEIHTLGANFDQALSKKYLSTVGVDMEADQTSGGVERWHAIAKLIGEMTAGVEVPANDTSDAEKAFTYNALGQPQFPATLAGQDPSSVSEMNAYIKAASEAVGGGGIIGQLPSTMSKDQKYDWIGYFKQGAFTDMYDLEAQAAASHSMALPQGWKHPGYPENTSTLNITWGPAVDGEKPAKETIPGEWTKSTYYNGLKASAEEIANYLIAAQMQNPTYLTLQERRSWVSAHQSHNQAVVDLLSVTAENRKKTGLPEQSPPLVWTWDLKPAKAYDSMFEGTDKYPTEGWTTQASGSYYDDNADKIPALKDAYNTASASGNYWVEDEKKQAAVVAYFQAIKDAEAAKALIPVYSKDATQTAQQSTHPIYNYHDQFGNKYFFKPAPAGDKYRSEVEHLGNQFGKLFGFSTTDSQVLTLDGQYGNLQKDVGGSSSLLNFNFGSLSSQQIADIGMEHILDHFLDNDDTKGDNAKITDNARIVGIDKGRAFKHFGAWKSLTADEQMDSNAATIYAKLYNAVRAGKFKKEDLDKAYLQIHKRAEKMQRVSDARITQMLAEGMANRKQWDIKYKIDGKPVPNNLAGMTAAVLDRKNHLVQDFDTMWAKVYKDAGLGTLPEPPKIKLAEDKPSGLDDPMLYESVFKVSAHGKATSLGSGEFKDGSAILWTDYNSDDTTNLNGETTLLPLAQEKVLQWAQAHATTASASKSDPSGLAAFDIFGDNIIGAAKTISHHVGQGDKAYNPDKISEFKSTQDIIAKDLAAWSPTMVGNTDDHKAFKFPSGQQVDMRQVDQYKLMLDFYKGQAAQVQQALSTDSKAPVITRYAPVALGNPPAVYINSVTGHKITKLANGDFIYNDGTTVSLLDHNGETGIGDIDWSKPGWQEVLKAPNGTDGWQAQADAPKDTKVGVKVTYRSTHNQQGEVKDGKLYLSGSPLSLGHPGSEYEVELPTGEKIWFRNASHTGTTYSQHGMLQFRLPNVSTDDDAQAGIARIMAQLEAMGLDPSAAEADTAERTYWRSMAQLLARRKHTSGGKYQKTWNDLKQEWTTRGITTTSKQDSTALEQFSATFQTPAEENEFWRNLWAKYFGKDKVDAFIQSEGYLPQYAHMDMPHPDIGTGKPKFRRLDVTDEDVVNSGYWLASTNTAGSDAMVKAAKSGGMLSTEERLRYYAQAIGGMSSFHGTGKNDQDQGSAGGIYTRIVSESAAGGGGYEYIYSPRSLLWTSTYTLSGDQYGAVNNQADDSPSDLKAAFAYASMGNETMLPDTAALGQDLEIIVFNNSTQRQEAIDWLKKRGIDTINGVAVEDRLVLAGNLKAALSKVKASWQTKK